MMANSADGRGIQAGLQFASESEVETSSILRFMVCLSIHAGGRLKI